MFVAYVLSSYNCNASIASPIVIIVATRGLLAVETVHAIVQWLANLNMKRNMTSMFVNKKHHYMLQIPTMRIKSSRT